MPLFHRQRLSDGEIEQITSTTETPGAPEAGLDAFARAIRDVGKQSPSASVEAQHLSAIVAESRRVREGAIERVIPSESSPRLRALPRRVGASVAVFTAAVALAAAGILPGPVQAAASDVLAVVGISIPDGDNDPGESDDAGRHQPRERDEPTPAEEKSRESVGDDLRRPRQNTDGDTTGQADRDPRRSSPTHSESTRDEDARRDTGERERDAEPQDDADDDDGRPNPDSGSDDEKPGDSDELPGSGDAGDEAGAGDRSAEDRSATGNGLLLTGSGDDLDEPEE